MERERLTHFSAKLKTFLLADSRRTLLLLCAAALVLVLLLTGSGKPKPQVQTDTTKQDEAAVQTQLCDLLGAIRGVGKVRVMLRFDSEGETVYARNTDATRQSGEQKDKSSVVIVKNGQSEGGLIVREQTPQVTGAAVVCEGGGDPVVRSYVVETLSALLGVKSNHISVMPM